ncbi:efflux RND transporter permease subunit [Saccharicrinis sp. FJH54]|uniref:efflux RND transporter permease subunit n=1 Tax=Saccharicrinis sp. FJH54 TaxID=3344665 RepID=UPI0035D437DC
MRFVVNRKVLISMLFLAVTMLGVISYKQLKIELFPSAELPDVYVQISSSLEVSPEYMEEKAVIPLEGVIGSLEGIDEIESTAGTRSGSIHITYQDDVDFKYAYLKLEERINSVRGSLPNEFQLNVAKADDQMQSMNTVLMELQVRGGGGTDRLRNVVDEKIGPELENIDGVAGITIYGGREKSVEVILNREACEAHHITPASVRRMLSASLQDRSYAGKITERGKRFFVYVEGEYQKVSDIEDLVIQDNIRLKDVATVFYGEKDETSISRVNGKDAVSIVVLNDAQANIIDVSHAVKNVIAEQNEKYAYLDVEVVVQQNLAEVMENNIDQIINLALTGGLLAIFILWVFLRNISLVTIVALAIPVSVYSAFNFFYAYDLTINSLTLVGLALAVGMLLDNSIVVLENIYRLRSAGYSPADSVIKGTREVWRSIVAATLTTITVFLPFLFSSNYLIELFGKHIGVSIISTLIVSLIVSMLLIPMAVHVVIKKQQAGKINSFKSVSIRNRSVRFYLLFLKMAFRNPVATILTGVVIFFVTIVGANLVSINTSQEVQTNDLRVSVTMPSGSTLEATDKLVTQIEDKLKDVEEIQDVISSIQEEDAILTLKLKDKFEKINDLSFADLSEAIQRKIGEMEPADISISGTASSGGLGTGGGSSGRGSGNRGNTGFLRMMGIGEEQDYIVIKGQDFDLMITIADDLEYYLEELDNVSRAWETARENQPEARINFDRHLMSDYNLSLQDVSTELNAFSRQVSSNVNFKQGNEEYEIMITYDTDTADTNVDKTFEDLRELQVSSSSDPNGTGHELGAFANVYTDRGIREITRLNQTKHLEVIYQFNNEIYESKALLEAAQMEVEQVVEAYNIPQGIAVEMVHEESDLNEFYTLFGIAFLLIYMILAAVFESFITPIVLLFSVPLAAIGSFLFLILSGNSLYNANTLTGFLILLGIVVNNGIILIDFTNILRKQGNRTSRALITAGLSRVRPILITAITTIVAMIPLAMGDAEYVSLIGVPFAITVIGGLSVSTIMTLVFIPTLYLGLENTVKWIKNLKLSVSIPMGVLVVAGLVLTIMEINTFTWQLIVGFLVITAIPAMVYFVLSSLKRASTKLIGDNEPIIITIQNLVKIYGRPSLFGREWSSSMAMSGVEVDDSKSRRELWQGLIWQLPLFGFLIYLGWFHMTEDIYSFIVAVIIYIMFLGLMGVFIRAQVKAYRFLNKLKTILFFGIPAIYGVLFYMRWHNLAMVIIISALWYLVIAAMAISPSLLSGRRKPDNYPKLFRWYVKLVLKIPGIGYQKEPFKALKGVSLEITTGMFGLLGPNGAGKSTMMRNICGILDQSYGKIWINGHDTEYNREELQGLIGYLPQEFGMYENMSAYAYLDYQAILKGITDRTLRKERIMYVLEAVHMVENKDKHIGSFSGGMKQRIGIAQILLHLPRILVVDEPTAGLDPRERIRFRNLLVELSRERVVIFSTHIIEDISSSCNYMAVINRGNVVYKGTPRAMADEAEGKVWRFSVPVEKFEEVTRDLIVVHHMREGKNIRVRCLSAEQPYEGAVNETPLLEDAYLWLIKSTR